MHLKSLVVSFILLLATNVCHSQTEVFTFLDSVGSIYHTDLPVKDRKEISTVYYLYSSAKKQSKYKNDFDKFIVSKSDNKFVYKLVDNESVSPNETGGLLIFNNYCTKTGYNSKDEKMMYYDVYLTTIEGQKKSKEIIFQYEMHYVNSSNDLSLNGEKMAFNKKEKQLYILADFSELIVYQADKNKKIVIKGVNNFKYDAKINEDYMEITLKSGEKLVYDCKKLKKTNGIALNFPVIEEAKKIKPVLQNAEWTFENGGSLNFTSSFLRASFNSVKNLSPSICEIKYEKISPYKYELFDLEKNKSIWLSDNIYKGSHVIYNKALNKIFTFEPRGVTLYDLTLQVKNTSGYYLKGIKSRADLYTTDIEKPFYNDDLKQLYWHVPSDAKIVIYNLITENYKVIDNAIDFVFDEDVSVQHILIKSKDQKSYYYDCKTFKNIGVVLPDNTANLALTKNTLNYKFDRGLRKLSLFKKDSLVASLRLPQSKILAAYIDDANKNVVYYNRYSDIEFGFSPLDNRDSLVFEKNNVLVFDKKKIDSRTDTNLLWANGLNEFRNLNVEVKEKYARLNFQRKQNYFTVDTTKLFNIKKTSNIYPYQTVYANNSENIPFKELEYKKTLSWFIWPDIFKIDEQTLLLAFGRVIYLIDLNTEKVNMFEFLLIPSGGIEYKQIKDDLFIINDKYVCSIKANKLHKKIEYKQGDFQFHYINDDYLYIAEALDEKQIKLQQIDVKTLEIVNQDIIESNFYRNDVSSYSEFETKLTDFKFLKDKIECYFKNEKEKITLPFSYSKSSIHKQNMDVEDYEKILKEKNEKEELNKLYVSQQLNGVEFTYLYISINEYYRFNVGSPGFKTNFDIHSSLDARYKGKYTRYKMAKAEVSEGHNYVSLDPTHKTVSETCTKCNGQKSSGGNINNCTKCSGSGFDKNTKCNSRGCVYGYQTTETLKVVVNASAGAWASVLVKTKRKCIWCLGTEYGLCSDCRGKGAQKTEIIKCDACKGSGITYKQVLND